MKHKPTILITIIFLLSLTSLHAQTKFEREFRIDEEAVPEKAVAFIDSCFGDHKIKWIKEESQDGKSFEAKTKYHKFCYSIEFDTLGNIQDIEKTVKFKTLQPEVIRHISNSLDSLFVKYKITKTQIQWKGAHDVLLELVQTGKSGGKYELAFEIVLKGKKEGLSKFYEILLDSRGKVLRQLVIVPRNTDNLEF
jgi:hypothetical protein